MVPSVYINLEDDVAKIVARVKKEKSDELILVCPKRCFLFNDSINLKLLKKQVDLLNKTVHILTMDERGQGYAKAAGFNLKFLPKGKPGTQFSDINLSKKNISGVTPAAVEASTEAQARDESKASVQEEAPEPDSQQTKISQTPLSLRREHLWGSLVSETPLKAEKTLEVNDSLFPEEIDQAYRIEKKKSKSKRVILIVVALSLILTASAVFLVLPKAEIVVFPKSENILREMEIAVGANVKEPDPLKLVLPGIWTEETVEISKQMESQGKKEVGNKASGLVRIYNFTRSPLNLKAGTTVFTAGTKNYLLSKDLSGLPITKYKNASTKEVDVASLGQPVEVVAQEGGESYNLPAATRLEITNQVFGSQPQFLYAKTDEGITGGTSRYLSLVSEADVESSRKVLQGEILNKLKEKKSDLDLAWDVEAFTFEDMAFSTDKPVGTQSPTFEARLTAKASGIVYKQSQLKQLVYERVKQTLSDNKELAPEQDKQLVFNVKSKDQQSQFIVISARFESKAFYTLKNLEELKGKMVFKKPEEVNALIRQSNSIDRLDILLSPAWQRYFPILKNKISIITNFTEF